MSDYLDGLSNIESLTAKINSLKANQPVPTTGNNSDPDSFILQTQQNFNSMLDSLMAPDSSQNGQPSSSDPFASFLDSSDQTALQQQLLTASNSPANIQRLAALEQNSALLGKQAIYQDQTGAQAEGVISKIMLDQNGKPVAVMADGSRIAVSAIVGLKQ